jgi:hypothetical protein
MTATLQCGNCMTKCYKQKAVECTGHEQPELNVQNDEGESFLSLPLCMPLAD